MIEDENYIHDFERAISPSMDSSTDHTDFYAEQRNPYELYSRLRKLTVSAAFLTASIIFISMVNLTDGLIERTISNEVVPISIGIENPDQTITISVMQNPILKPDCSVSERFPSRILQWCQWITSYADKHSLPADLIAAIIWQESGGDPKAYSRSGAVGLMQVMPSDGLAASFMCINGPCFKDRPTTDQLLDPEFNIKYGSKMLARLVAHYGGLREALKSYGPKDVGYYYSDKVLGLYKRYGNHP
jgi:hypothetical protein